MSSTSWTAWNFLKPVLTKPSTSRLSTRLTVTAIRMLGGVRFGQRFERYSRPQAQQLSETGNKEKTEATGGTAGFSDGPSVEEDRGVTRTGGTWAAKYGKSIADWDKAPPTILYGTFQSIEALHHLGRKLLRSAAVKKLHRMAETFHLGELHDGYG